MDSQELVRKLQIVLGTRIATGQVTLNLREGRLESFETKTYARLKATRGEKGLDSVCEAVHTG
jgi:hypothetical protein